MSGMQLDQWDCDMGLSFEFRPDIIATPCVNKQQSSVTSVSRLILG